jgi:ribosomal protein L18
LSLSHKQCQIITVAENKTLIQVPASMLKIPTLQVNSYLEAVGVLVAHKAGINPSSLTINN